MATRILMTLSAITLCATGFSGAVQAETMDQTDAPATKLVPYTDLNLASEEGQNTLAVRIRSAVREVCGNAGSRDLKAKQQNIQCQAEAMRLARIQKSDAIAQYRNGQRVAAANRVIVGN